MRYVIIGGSAAAIGCIEGVRSVDKTGEIILITGETEWNYSRPLISYPVSYTHLDVYKRQVTRSRS